jgi:hypothetical protein
LGVNAAFNDTDIRFSAWVFDTCITFHLSCSKEATAPSEEEMYFIPLINV